MFINFRVKTFTRSGQSSTLEEEKKEEKEFAEPATSQTPSKLPQKANQFTKRNAVSVRKPQIPRQDDCTQTKIV